MENRYLKYPREAVRGIAEEIGMGMVCFLDTGTMKYESEPGESYGIYRTGGHDGLYREVRKMVAGWKLTVTVVPPESWQSRYHGALRRGVHPGRRRDERPAAACHCRAQAVPELQGRCREQRVPPTPVRFQTGGLGRFVLEQLIQSV